MEAPSVAATEACLETPRLWLEPLQPRHAVELFDHLQDPEVYRYIEAPPPADVASLRERYARLATRRSPDGLEVWLNWVVRARASLRCVGRVEITLDGAGRAELGYVFDPASWGRGYATEACTRVLAWLEEHAAGARVEAHIDPRNARSRALVARLGFLLVTDGAPEPAGEGEPRDLVFRLAP